MTKVVTRIAPSPTGMMHIGTARTAIFNYLYARKHGGEFKLRIEDTDEARNTPEAVAAIRSGLSWLGLDIDGRVVSQAANADRHREVANLLLGKGLAYRCYLTPDEATALKTQGVAFRSPYRDPINMSPDLYARGNTDAPFVIRFKGPTEGAVVVKDAVRGDVNFDASNLDDLVLLRSDGNPTYNLAVVVDDHDMEVTHVIRGDDHLNNAARQQLIYEAMGWAVPVWAHIPLIHDDKGKKLSKRSGTAASIEDYAAMGYTRDGLFNYLCRLGWGHGDDENFTRDQAIEWFDIADVVSSPARLDINKLNSVSNWHIRNTEDSRLALSLAGPLHRRYPDVKTEDLDLDLFVRAAGCLKEGATTKEGLFDKIVPFMFPVTPDDKAKAAIIAGQAELRKVVSWVRDSQTYDFWASPATLNDAIRWMVENRGLTMKSVGQPVRSALTGTVQAPDLGTCFYILGYDKTVERLNAALAV